MLRFVARALPAALLVALAMPATAAAQQRTPFQAQCEDTLGETISVLSSRQEGYRIDNSRSYYDLTRLKGNVRRGSWVLGLTHTEARVSIKVGGRMLIDQASGYECVAPRIDVNLYYAPIVIYVSREFPPGSCSYQEVLAHELRHLRTYQDFLPRAETIVRTRLAARFAGKPLYAPIGQARSLLQREVDRSWMPYIKREMEKVEVLQAAIDTPQEYARLGKVCAGEVQSLLRQASRSRS
ncbi:hypothetical protein [Telluria beijingensis]|uniref:hypothetical protein n=1 Tax=Telluria beijingensis TaxID=3068633 RepID=UPI0027961192|nr:hypothetical protein [Massilia sp. REN29]